MELLERVIGEDHRPGPLGDAQHEGVAPADGPSRRRHDLTVELGFSSCSRSEGSMRCSKEASTTTTISAGGPRRRRRGPPRPAAPGSASCGPRWPGSTRRPPHGVFQPSDRQSITWAVVLRDGQARPQPTARSSRSDCSSWCRACCRWPGWPIRPGSRGGAGSDPAAAGGGGRGRRTTPPCSRAPLGARPPRSAPGIAVKDLGDAAPRARGRAARPGPPPPSARALRRPAARPARRPSRRARASWATFPLRTGPRADGGGVGARRGRRATRRRSRSPSPPAVSGRPGPQQRLGRDAPQGAGGPGGPGPAGGGSTGRPWTARSPGGCPGRTVRKRSRRAEECSGPWP